MRSDGPTVFISYSSTDSDFANRLKNDLQAQGVTVWVDKQDIQPGQVWSNVLKEAIRDTDRFLVILSPDSVQSHYVLGEIAHAIDLRKSIIPILYRKCDMPIHLLSLHYADFMPGYEQGMESLKRALGSTGVVVGSQANQKVAKGAAAAANVGVSPKDSEKKRLEEEENRNRLEAEQKQAAEQARLKAERQRKAAERKKLEAEQKEAEEQARLEEEKRKKAAERKRLETKRRAAERAAEQARVEEEREAAEETEDQSLSETAQEGKLSTKEMILLILLIGAVGTLLDWVGSWLVHHR